MTTIHTIGHGTRSTAELVEVLHEAGVELLVDVRRYPGSRRSPHLAREALERDLPERGVAYEWWGEELGGRRSPVRGRRTRHPAWRNEAFQGYADYMDTAEFTSALERLLEHATGGVPLAVMCAETLWWRCHRRLIADALVLRGIEVVHLLGPGRSEPHLPHPGLRQDDQGRPVYDVGVDRSLFD